MVVGYLKSITYRTGRLLCCRWCLDMFLGYKKAFFSQHMSDSKVGGLIEKSIFWDFTFALKLWLTVVDYPKILTNWAGRLPFFRWCFDMFLGYKEVFFSQHMNDVLIQKKILRLHICSKSLVMGHQKIITDWSVRLFCCRWYLDMFLEYKKSFFSQHMNDKKEGGLIEKKLFETSYLL